MASMGNLPQTVSTTKVARSDWQPKLQAVGSLKQHAGKSKREAIEIAAGIRLRPILMTTAAMVLGVIPLITATGAGALSRFSMGLVIASGMALGTLFTLFVVPAVYVMLAADHSKTGRRRRPAPSLRPNSVARLPRRNHAKAVHCYRTDFYESGF